MTRLSVEPLEERTVPAALWAVGAGPGSPGTASLVDAATGKPRFTVTPFGPDFTGGVSAAAADVNGDTVPDLVVAAGAGRGSQVAVFDGATGRPIAGPLASFTAFEPAFTGGVEVAAGDVNADGYADVVVAASAGGGPRVSVYDGKTGAVLRSFMAFEDSFTGGVHVAAADVNGDGRADVIVAPGTGGGPRVRAFSGATGAELFDRFAYSPEFRGGAYVAAGDMDRDGAADVITGAGPGGGPDVRCFRADGTPLAGFFAGDPSARAGVRVGCLPGGAPELLASAGGAVTGFDLSGKPLAAVAGAITLPPEPAQAGDAVLDWVGVLLRAVRDTAAAPPQAARALGTVSAAVYDAVAATVPGYQQYRTAITAPAGASADAAAAVAAARALEYLFPGLTDRFEADLAASLAMIPDGHAKDDGKAVGEQAAQAIIDWRKTDGADKTVPYTPGTAQGEYELTPPAFKPSLDPQWPQVTPFAMTRGDQFRPPAPPSLDSPEYAADLAAVKAIGGATSSVRTPEQALIAHFWADVPGTTVTPPGHWYQIAAAVSRAKGLTLAENARLFGLLGVALADAAVVSWDAKYAYNFWRPVTAIQQTDPNWTPLWATPNFPSYTSGHSTFSGAASEVLAAVLGPDTPFVAGTDDMPDAARSFGSFRQAAEEAGASRIYGGIHYEFDNQAGLASGRALGQYVVANVMKPA